MRSGTPLQHAKPLPFGIETMRTSFEQRTIGRGGVLKEPSQSENHFSKCLGKVQVLSIFFEWVLIKMVRIEPFGQGYGSSIIWQAEKIVQVTSKSKVRKQQETHAFACFQNDELGS